MEVRFLYCIDIVLYQYFILLPLLVLGILWRRSKGWPFSLQFHTVSLSLLLRNEATCFIIGKNRTLQPLQKWDGCFCFLRIVPSSFLFSLEVSGLSLFLAPSTSCKMHPLGRHLCDTGLHWPQFEGFRPLLRVQRFLR